METSHEKLNTKPKMLQFTSVYCFFNGFSRLNFAPKPVPPASPKAPLLHAEQHSARADHQHQGQQLGAQHLACLRGREHI